MIAAILATMTISARRWGIIGGIAGLLGACGLMYGWLFAWARFELSDRQTMAGPALLLLGCWFVFRRQPV
ncbi:hypothetical protein [Tessaracoccus coleopterorum]|uniref:hypothetical protein n=1 Tax=Tessaracoccus coleopterorum TaxID=2714950 RepID=UPI001E491BD9|nr:hypothetical protein [Tessaracoccus coleopterorum]